MPAVEEIKTGFWVAIGVGVALIVIAFIMRFVK